MSARTFIACDQALANTGFAIAHMGYNGQLKLVGLGTIKTHSEETLYQRLLKIKRWVRTAIEEHKPEMFFVEEVFTRQGGQQLKGDSTPLIMVQAVICLELFEQEIPFWVISSSARKKDSWRKTLSLEGGIGNKKLSKEFLLRLLPDVVNRKEFKVSEHSSDAFCLLIAGLILHNRQFNNFSLDEIQGIIDMY